MEDNKNIMVEQGGIQCDACDWKDDTPLSTKELEAYLNKPCPKCGENLLTEDDLLEYAKFMAAINTVNAMDSSVIEQFESLLDEDAIIDAYQIAKTKGLSQTRPGTFVYDQKSIKDGKKI